MMDNFFIENSTLSRKSVKHVICVKKYCSVRRHFLKVSGLTPLPQRGSIGFGQVEEDKKLYNWGKFRPPQPPTTCRLSRVVLSEETRFHMENGAYEKSDVVSVREEKASNHTSVAKFIEPKCCLMSILTPIPYSAAGGSFSLNWAHHFWGSFDRIG